MSDKTAGVLSSHCIAASNKQQRNFRTPSHVANCSNPASRQALTPGELPCRGLQYPWLVSAQMQVIQTACLNELYLAVLKLRPHSTATRSHPPGMQVHLPQLLCLLSSQAEPTAQQCSPTPPGMQVRQSRLLPGGRARQVVPRRVAGLAVQSRCQLRVHLLQHREGCSRQACAVGLGRHLVVQQVSPCSERQGARVSRWGPAGR